MNTQAAITKQHQIRTFFKYIYIFLLYFGYGLRNNITLINDAVSIDKYVPRERERIIYHNEIITLKQHNVFHIFFFLEIYSKYKLKQIPIEKNVPPTLGLEKIPNNRFSQTPMRISAPLRPGKEILIWPKNIYIQKHEETKEINVYDFAIEIISLLLFSKESPLTNSTKMHRP